MWSMCMITVLFNCQQSLVRNTTMQWICCINLIIEYMHTRIRICGPTFQISGWNLTWSVHEWPYCVGACPRYQRWNGVGYPVLRDRIMHRRRAQRRHWFYGIIWKWWQILHSGIRLNAIHIFCIRRWLAQWIRKWKLYCSNFIFMINDWYDMSH